MSFELISKQGWRKGGNSECANSSAAGRRCLAAPSILPKCGWAYRPLCPPDSAIPDY